MTCVLRALLTGTAAIAYLLAACSSATAGVFSVAACDAGPASSTNAWAADRTAPEGQLEFVNQCPAGSPDPYGSLENGVGVRDVMKVLGADADGAHAEWRFVAPTGTVISSASITRDIGNRDEWTPYGRIDGADVPGESCVPGMGQAFCRIQGTRTFASLNARSIAYGVRCVTAPYCAHLWDLRAVWVLVLGATVTLDDRQAPTVSAVEPTGVADGRWWNRAGVVWFSADDNTGIRQRRVVVDGVQRVVVDAPGAVAGGCGELGRGVAYTYSRPCADGRGLNGLSTVAVDPCRWGDGVHAVRGGVTDTGGMEALSPVAVSVRVDCSAPDVVVDVPVGEVLEGEVVAPVVSVSDGPSGVRETVVEVGVDDGPWLPHEGDVLAETGRSYRFRARAVDVAGNGSDWVVTGAVVGVAPPPAADEDPEAASGGGGGTPAPLPVQLPAPVAHAVPVLAIAAEEGLALADVERPVDAARPEEVAQEDELVVPQDARLRISRVTRRRRKVVVAGTSAPALTTHAAVRVTPARGRPVTLRAPVRAGRWRATFRRVDGIRRVTVETAASGAFASGRATWSPKRLHPLR